jgi:hypothetical protein
MPLGSSCTVLPIKECLNGIRPYCTFWVSLAVEVFKHVQLEGIKSFLGLATCNFTLVDKPSGFVAAESLCLQAAPQLGLECEMPIHYVMLQSCRSGMTVQIRVLERVIRSKWGAPTFIIPKKDGTVLFISDFRELNKKIVQRLYPIPHIQDMLLNLDGFQYATSLDLNMGFYHIELNPECLALHVAHGAA